MKAKFLCLIVALAAVFTVIGVTTTHEHRAFAASCTDGNGHFSVNYTTGALYSPYTSFSQIGGTGESDTGVQWACDGQPYAIMFFADYDEPYTHLGGSDYRFNVNVAVDPTDDEFEIALIGLTHGNPGNAVDIRLCTTAGCSEHDEEIFGSSIADKVLPRGNSSSSELSNWTTPTSDKIKVKIDGEALYQKVLNNEVTYEHNEAGGYYKISIYNYRCFNTPGPGTHCGTSTTYLTMKADQKAQFTGKSEVSQTSITSTDGTYDVIFTHTVERIDAGGYSIYNNCSTSASATGAPYAANTTGTGKNCNFTSFSTGDKKITTDRVQGTIYPGQTIKLCENMTYNDFVHTIESNLTTSKTTDSACVTITRPQALCAADSGYIYTHAGGTNMGRIGIANLTQGTGVQYSPTTGYTNTNRTQFAPNVYAKPGDSIQFTYDMCAGAELANRLNFSPKHKITYTPSATSSTGNSDNYLFGESVTTWKNDATTGFLGDLYEYTTTSPHNTSKYECAVYNQTTNYFRSNTYQVPGLVAMPSPTNNCKSANEVAKPSDVGSTISQSLTWTNMTITNRTTKTGSGNYTATAKLIIPYNYRLKATFNESTAVRNVTAGMQVGISYKLDVAARKNSLVQEDNYATHSKKTSYRVFQWYESADVDIDTIKSRLGTAIGDGYYSTSDFGASKTTLVAPTTPTAILGKIDTINATVTIGSNVAVGTKVCMAMSAYPADSHNNPGLADAGTIDQTIALQGTGSGYYISEPTCYTVSKKPSFIVKGGSGLYAYNGAESALTKRVLNDGTTYSFSSWSEYAIASTQLVRGVASGASRWGGTNEAQVSGYRACYFSSLTLANENCDSATGEVGKISLSGNYASSPESLKNQIITRYAASTNSAGAAVKDYKNQTVDLSGVCTYDASSGRYVAPAGAKFDCLSNGTKYTYSSGDLTVSGGHTLTNYCMSPALTDYDSRTSVVHVAGTLYVDANFYYGQKVGSSCLYHNEIYGSMHKMPQQIIIANKVVFKERVTHYDGWVVADTVNTCDVSPTDGTNGININRCNSQLKIGGPVLTRYLNLYRTRGGGNNRSTGIYDSSNGDRATIAEPAEIFSIGPETYLWAYQQSTRYSQAFTTYQRELPPRY